MSILKNAAINEPRIDYNPADGTLRGLLIEEQRTNSLLNNRNLGGGGWSGSATIAQNETGIDGAANTAWTVADSDAGGIPGRTQNITVPDDSNRHTVSMYVRKTAATQYGGFRLSLTGGTTAVGGGVGDAFLRPSDGAASTQDTGIAVHEGQDAGDWWRLIASIDNNNTGNTVLQVIIYPAANTDGSNGINPATTGALIVDYVQVELNSGTAGSPIETTGSAVTRAADVVTSAIVGTLPSAYSYDITATPGQDKDAVLYQVDDGTENNRVRLERIAGSLHYTITSGGVEQANLNLGALTDFVEFTVRCRVAAGDFAASLNGATSSTDITGSVPTGLTTRRLGQDTAGNHWNGWIKDATEIPHALNNTELEA